MRELLLFTIGGLRYGAWKDRVLSVEEVGSVHRLPFLRSSLTVLAVIGDHTRTLADLQHCLGHEPTREKGAMHAFLMSEQGSIRGFLLSGEISTREPAPGAVVPLPGYLEVPFMEGCLADALPVTIIDLSKLFDQIVETGQAPSVSASALKDLRLGEADEQGAYRVTAVGRNLLAFPAHRLAEKPLADCRVSRFPLLPPDIDGIAFCDGRLLPVIDLSQRISERSRERRPVTLEVRLGDAAIGLIVEEDRGEWGSNETRVVDLPLICQAFWLRSAVIHKREVAALVDIAALVSTPPSEIAGIDLDAQYVPDSKFPSVFGSEDLEILEFKVLERRYAVPKIEIVDVVPSEKVRRVPVATGLVCGVVDHGGELSPVLDLARMVGQDSVPSPDWRMILLKNGNFRAFILTESAPASASGQARGPARSARGASLSSCLWLLYGRGGCQADPQHGSACAAFRGVARCRDPAGAGRGASRSRVAGCTRTKRRMD